MKANVMSNTGVYILPNSWPNGPGKKSAFEKEGKKIKDEKGRKKKKREGKEKRRENRRKKKEKRGKKEKKESARVVIFLDYSSRVEYYLLC